MYDHTPWSVLVDHLVAAVGIIYIIITVLLLIIITIITVISHSNT